MVSEKPKYDVSNDDDEVCILHTNEMLQMRIGSFTLNPITDIQNSRREEHCIFK